MGSVGVVRLLAVVVCALVAATLAPGRALAASAYAEAVAADSPRAYWRLGEASGSVAADTSGNGLTSSYLNGVTLGVPGVSGDGDAAASFDGVDDRLSRALVSAQTADLTLEAWVYPEGTLHPHPLIVYNGHSGLNGYGLYLSDGSCGYGDVFYVLAGGVACNAAGSGGAIRSGEWTHLVATRTAAGVWTVYVNGESKNTGWTTSPFL